MSNLAAAQKLLDYGLPIMKGVVFLDEYDRQMVLLRKGRKVVKLAESGLAWGERFTFYDQVHTTGMDIKQAVDANAALTLGKDMVRTIFALLLFYTCINLYMYCIVGVPRLCTGRLPHARYRQGPDHHLISRT